MPLTYTPAGGEHLVNSTTAGEQSTPWIAGLPDGGYIVTWTSDFQDGSSYGVYSQRYNVFGNLIGGETRVNTTTANSQDWSVIAVFEDGGYVVVWTSVGQDGSAEGIYAQRYDMWGNPVGAEFRVNTTTSNNQTFPTIAALEDGGFVIAWQSVGQDGQGYGIYAQRYDSSGVAQGAEFRVNTTTLNEQQLPAIAALDDGGYVVTWTSYQQDGIYFGNSIWAQRYDASGIALGSESLVNTWTAGTQARSAVTALPDGGYVVTWQSENGQDGSGSGIYMQRFNSSGQAVGSEIRVNTTTAYGQFDPSIATLEDGGYVIVWISEFQDGSGHGIYGQAYDSTGAPVDGEFQVNTTTFDRQAQPMVAALEGGGFIITWTSYSRDGSVMGVCSQRYEAVGRPSGADATLNMAEDSSHVFSITDFGFSDSNGNNFSGVVINTTPADGRLTLNGVMVAPGDFISVADIAAGNLLFTPALNANGDDWASFTFRVRDDGIVNHTDSSANTITFDVSSVNDSPWGTIGPTGYVPAGSETPVNEYTEYSQQDPSAAALGDGGYVVAWTSWQDDGSYGISLQRYDFTGLPVGGETIVSSAVPEHQSPSVAALSDGGYVVVYRSFGIDSDGYGIFAQRYDSTGAAVGGETPINTAVANNQFDPAVTGLADGGYVVVWVSMYQDGSSTGVYLQRYDSSGNPQGMETLVNTSTADGQGVPSVTALADGGFVVTWISDDPDGTGTLVCAQRYDSTGAAAGSETVVNITEGVQLWVSAAPLENGGYVVVWHDWGSGAILAQMFDSSGLPAGAEFRANPPDVSSSSASVAALDGGGFVISWTSSDSGQSEIRAQAYDSSGELVGAATAAGNAAGLAQYFPVAVGLAGGGYAIAWASYDDDISDWNIHVQLFDSGIYALEQTPHSLLGTVSISDVDAGSGIISATLSVDSGTLILTHGTSDATILGSGTSNITINGTLAQINALLAGDTGGTFDYVAQGDVPPASANLTLSVADNGNSGSGPIRIGGTDAAITISPVDDAPTGADATLAIDEVRFHTFSAGDFNFADVDGHAFAGIVIVSLPLSGALSLNGVQVTSGQAVSAADIAAGKFVFAPAGNEYGDNYASFTFQVVDSGSANNIDPSANIITFDVEPGGIVGTEGNDLLNGTSGNDLIYALGGNDAINALGGNDTLNAGAGNDVINGGSGADSMTGGLGDDTFHVDNAGDTTVEAASAGYDSVFASLTWALGANVEKLVLTGTGAIDGTGNGLDNLIVGNAAANRLEGLGGNDSLSGGDGNDTLVGGLGNDTLTGGLGDDSMSGGSGNDIYFVDSLGNAITELAGEGSDTIYSSITLTLGSEVEKLVLSGTAAINGFGNALANHIVGNSGDNLIEGGGGNDNLSGHIGNDVLDGGTGSDWMIGGAGDDISTSTQPATSLSRMPARAMTSSTPPPTSR